jgi:hypothetical protein
MPRGGKRVGAGGKFKWNHGKTRVIRVPDSLANDILEFARRLDASDYDCVTETKIIDLSGVSVFTKNGKSCIFLSDLLFLGYEIKPDKLTEIIISEAYKDQLIEGI